METVGIVGAIGKDLLSVQPADQVPGRCHVVLLARPQDEADRQSERIDYGMDFDAEPAARAAERLGLSAPLFTRAPAAWA